MLFILRLVFGIRKCLGRKFGKNNPDVKVVVFEGIDLIYGEHHHSSGTSEEEDEHRLLPDHMYGLRQKQPAFSPRICIGD